MYFFIYKYKLFLKFHNSFIFILYFNILCSTCSILIFRNTIFYKYSISFFCLPHWVYFFIINFKCYFILFQFSQTHLQYFWQHFLLKLCLTVVFFMCLFSLFIVLSHILSELFLLGFHLWLLFYNFFFKSCVFWLTPCLFFCINR